MQRLAVNSLLALYASTNLNTFILPQKSHGAAERLSGQERGDITPAVWHSVAGALAKVYQPTGRATLALIPEAMLDDLRHILWQMEKFSLYWALGTGFIQRGRTGTLVDCTAQWHMLCVR
jgi:hypothetical protein